jgi:hypothetical protein
MSSHAREGRLEHAERAREHRIPPIGRLSEVEAYFGVDVPDSGGGGRSGGRAVGRLATAWSRYTSDFKIAPLNRLTRSTR